MTKCCMCGKKFEGKGHNPYPIKKDGRCCDACNVKVTEYRLAVVLGRPRPCIK